MQLTYSRYRILDRLYDLDRDLNHYTISPEQRISALRAYAKVISERGCDTLSAVYQTTYPQGFHDRISRLGNHGTRLSDTWDVYQDTMVTGVSDTGEFWVLLYHPDAEYLGKFTQYNQYLTSHGGDDSADFDD